MESCFRFSILEFVFSVYIYIFLLFRLYDAQKMDKTLCEQNVSDCFNCNLWIAQRASFMCTVELNRFELRPGGPRVTNPPASLNFTLCKQKKEGNAAQTWKEDVLKEGKNGKI